MPRVLIALLVVIASTPATELISRSVAGVPAHGHCEAPAATPDCRFVAFVSFADNLVPGDTNGVADVFLRDRLAGTIERIDVDDEGAQADGGADGSGFPPALSADGRFVVFWSRAANLAEGDASAGLFLRDRAEGTTTRLTPPDADVDARAPAISRDGSQIVYFARLPGRGGWSEPLLLDLASGVTSSLVPPLDGDCEGPAWFSADGRWLVFASAASGLVGGDRNGAVDAFTLELATGAIERVSVGAGNAPLTRGGRAPTISGDGRLVAFTTNSPELTSSSAVAEVWIHDRATGATTPGCPRTGAATVDRGRELGGISDDGRWLFFVSYATDVVAGDQDGAWDLFARDLLAGGTRVVNLPVGDQPAGRGVSRYAAASASGAEIAYLSDARNLTGDALNGLEQVFVGPNPIVPAPTAALRVNFQPAGTPAPPGYRIDDGEPFGERGDGWSYGWSEPVATVARGSRRALDPRYDSFAWMQAPGRPDAVWEVALPEGTYRVLAACGDAAAYDGNIRLLAEGRPVVTARLDAITPWAEDLVDVLVSDGRLTLSSAPGSYNTKLDYVDIRPVIHARVNFAPATSPPVPGWLVDSGEAYGPRGGGWTYGWDRLQDLAVDRHTGVDRLHDTVIPMQPGGNAATWSIALPTADYRVHVVCGDPSSVGQHIKLDVQGLLAINGATSLSMPWREATIDVPVTNGRLSLSCRPGSAGTTLALIEIDQL